MPCNFFKTALLITSLTACNTAFHAQETYIKYNQQYIKSLGEDHDTQYLRSKYCRGKYRSENLLQEITQKNSFFF